jgi:hypothetical protein
MRVALERRRGEEAPEPVLAVAVVGQGLEVEALLLLVPRAAAEVVEPAAGLGPGGPVIVPRSSSTRARRHVHVGPVIPPCACRR